MPAIEKKLRIGLVANFWLTPTLHAVAQRLSREYGCEIHWFTFSPRWYRWLIRSGESDARIIRLYRGVSGSSTAPADAWRDEDEPDLVHLVQSDRVLGRRSSGEASATLQKVAARVREALEERKLDVIFGESTWSAEIVLGYAAREWGVPYLSPVALRVPSGRLGFVRGPLHKRFIDVGHMDRAEAHDLAVETYSQFISGATKLAWAQNASTRFSAMRYVRKPGSWMRGILDAIFDSKGNPTQPTLPELLRNRNPFRLHQNASALRAFMTEHAVNDPEEVDSAYVLMPLHVQPEASVDVVAWTASDQTRNVMRVSKALPPGMVVAVKEHSHQFGFRNVRIFESLRTLDNVRFVDPWADSRKWMRNARAVISPSGTMCLENALEGRRSIVMSSIFFDSLPSVLRLDDAEVPDLTALLNVPLPDDARQVGVEYLESVIVRSVEGTFAAERDIPGALSHDNVANLAAGFIAAARAVNRTKAIVE